jgi:cellulose biosynthesis protein BcsQ
MRVLATYNLKGGVGKTSAAVNLSALATKSGLRTLVWDLDPQGAASYLLRIRPKVKGGGRKLVQGRSDSATLLRGSDIEGLDLLPADFSYRNLDLALDETKKPTRRMRKVLAPLAPYYDVALVDCPPAISLASENVFDVADALLVPLIPSNLSLRTFERIVDFVGNEVEQPPRLVAFFSMVDGRKKLHRQIIEELSANHATVARTAIPAATEVEQMGLHRAPLVCYAPRSRAAGAYRALWDEVRTRLGF